jgi:hypothetical protein
MKLAENPYTSLNGTLYESEWTERGWNEGQQTTLKAVVEWGKEACTHPIGKGFLRRECSACWNDLEKEVKERNYQKIPLIIY